LHKGLPGASRQGGQQGLHRGVIPESLAAMGKAVDIARSEDKTAAQLEWIPPELVLRMTGGFGEGARLGIVASQQVKQVRALEFHGGISFAIFVNEQWEGDSCLLAKSAGIDAVPKPHRGEVRSTVAESLLVRAQLRDVLAAKDSTVMPQENNHCRLPDP
jgi:hypothetical protein